MVPMLHSTSQNVVAVMQSDILGISDSHDLTSAFRMKIRYAFFKPSDLNGMMTNNMMTAQKNDIM
jgi:hypothetical protein